MVVVGSVVDLESALPGDSAVVHREEPGVVMGSFSEGDV